MANPYNLALRQMVIDADDKQPPATPKQHQQVHQQPQSKQQGPKSTIHQNLVQSMQQIDVRMKRHPELQPYVPSDRDRLMIKNKKSANGSGGPDTKPKLGQRKYVSMNRINQLAQPKKVVQRNPQASSASNSTSTSTTTSLPAEDEEERRKKAEEDEERRKKAEEEEERIRKAEEEEARKIRAEEELAERRKAEEDEERRKRAEEEEERRRKAEEDLRKKAEQEEEERKSRSLLVASILSKFNQSS